MILPVLHPATGEVVGTIDVESDRPNAFSPRDKDFLEDCANVTLALWTESPKIKGPGLGVMPWRTATTDCNLGNRPHIWLYVSNRRRGGLRVPQGVCLLDSVLGLI